MSHSAVEIKTVCGCAQWEAGEKEVTKRVEFSSDDNNSLEKVRWGEFNTNRTLSSGKNLTAQDFNVEEKKKDVWTKYFFKASHSERQGCCISNITLCKVTGSLRVSNFITCMCKSEVTKAPNSSLILLLLKVVFFSLYWWWCSQISLWLFR